MRNIYEVLNLAVTEKAPTRVKLSREKLAQREYQDRIAQAVREHSAELYDARLEEGGITDRAFESVFGHRVSQLTILLMAACYTRAQIVVIMGIKEGAICNYLTQCTDREVFYVQEPSDVNGNDGVLRIASEEEWEKHRIAGASVDPIAQTKKAQTKLARLEKSLEEAKERLASVVSRLVAAKDDEDLQIQHKYLKGKVDMLEVEVLWCQQTLSALPPVAADDEDDEDDEADEDTNADEGTDEDDLFE